MTKRQIALAECREQIQEDLLCYFDGMEDDVLDYICAIIVKNFKALKKKLEETK